MWYEGDLEGIGDTLGYWMVANAALAGVGVVLAGASNLYTSRGSRFPIHFLESGFGCWMVRRLHPI